ncbi:hypothetical protein Peur_010352 [Populus x canadensis]
MEITAKTYENDVDVNIGNKYFLTTMQSSDDLEVKKWVQEVKKIYGKHNRQGVAAGLNACRSIGFASCRYYKQEDFTTVWEVTAFFMVFMPTRDPFSNVFLYDKRTIVAGVGIEGVVKKLEEENEGLLITTRRVELREAAKKAFP